MDPQLSLRGSAVLKQGINRLVWSARLRKCFWAVDGSLVVDFWISGFFVAMTLLCGAQHEPVTTLGNHLGPNE
jgi:hypothetical protein